MHNYPAADTESHNKTCKDQSIHYGNLMKHVVIVVILAARARARTVVIMVILVARARTVVIVVSLLLPEQEPHRKPDLS